MLKLLEKLKRQEAAKEAWRAAGVVLLGLLLLASPVAAQTADPVGLIGSAAILPFWAGGPFLTIFEITSLGENQNMHAFFFNASCNRVFSLPFAMTAHDAAIAGSDEAGLTFNGLMALARSDDNITPTALESAITLRGHRVDFLFDAVSTIDPISAANAEDPTRTWNPLRSGATTITFPDAPPFTSTRWWIVCPSNHVVLDLGGGIPPFPPGASLIRFRVYNLDEDPVLDLQVACTCLTPVTPATLHPVVFNQSRYVELVSTVSATPEKHPPSFVLYRELRFGPTGGFAAEDFGRAPGMSAASLISGVPVPLAR